MRLHWLQDLNITWRLKTAWGRNDYGQARRMFQFVDLDATNWPQRFYKAGAP